MPEASADDVRLEIDTNLDDADIEGADGDADDDGILGRIEREWKREYDADKFEDAQHIADFEAALAALRIAEGRDRRGEQVQSGRSRRTYEAEEIAQIRKRVRRDDPGNEFGHAGTIRRDSGRHVTSTGEN